MTTYINPSGLCQDCINSTSGVCNLHIGIVPKEIPSIGGVKKLLSVRQKKDWSVGWNKGKNKS